MQDIVRFMIIQDEGDLSGDVRSVQSSTRPIRTLYFGIGQSRIISGRGGFLREFRI